ncbi:hypothetical protein LWE61_18170 [Sphingobium sufflavum]|uniref:hypothetical protein n=1 Tax=Sphingobium sufflavum TaxID=1129547 RepID=UPI001F1CBF13|nr:hypothetical protein [Sphingobium sufflavum]MCE7798468.1 hypothetical protein [Sphingobium sufflavum]
MPVLTLIALAAAAPVPLPACTHGPERRFLRLKQVPPGAVAAMGMTMAEKGEPFQATDALTRPALPRSRFVSAVQRGCRLTLSYEQGGIAHRWSRIVLIQGRTGWTVGG